MMTGSIDNLLFQDLPYRAEQLDVETMSNIFGGCNSNGQSCQDDKDCCSNNCDLPVDTGNGIGKCK
jgi:hypothetical protein